MMVVPSCPWPYPLSSCVLMKVRPFASMYALEYICPFFNPFLRWNRHRTPSAGRLRQ
jgi:hypothetical protein